MSWSLQIGILQNQTEYVQVSPYSISFLLGSQSLVQLPLLSDPVNAKDKIGYLIVFPLRLDCLRQR